MKILINVCYGGFEFNDDFIKALPFKKEEFENIGVICYLGGEEIEEVDIKFGDFKRNNENIIKAVEDFGIENVSGEYSSIKIIEIPDESTDWTINEYDGTEEVIYVLDGKIKYAC